MLTRRSVPSHSLSLCARAHTHSADIMCTWVKQEVTNDDRTAVFSVKAQTFLHLSSLLSVIAVVSCSVKVKRELNTVTRRV